MNGVLLRLGNADALLQLPSMPLFIPLRTTFVNIPRFLFGACVSVSRHRSHCATASGRQALMDFFCVIFYSSPDFHGLPAGIGTVSFSLHLDTESGMAMGNECLDNQAHLGMYIDCNDSELCL